MSPLPDLARELGAAPVFAGKYRLVRPLAAGGMGAVWVACNEATGAEVALKVLRDGNGSAELVERLRREAHATASLSHRGIVRIYDLIDFGPKGEQVAIVMELLQGETLGDHLSDHGRLSEQDAVAILLPVLSALAHAHGCGVTHRDLKPDNVFLAVDSDAVMTPKILDFGISKQQRGTDGPGITHRGELVGTPSYMSPEQVGGSATVDGRSDLFTIGILLYEMLSGRTPFVGDDIQQILVAIVEAEPEPLPDVTPPMWQVIAKTLRKLPEERFANATELAAALRAAVGLPEAPCSLADTRELGVVPEPSPALRPQRHAAGDAAHPATRSRGRSVAAALAGAVIAVVFAAWTPGEAARASATATDVVADPASSAKDVPVANAASPDTVTAFVVDSVLLSSADAGPAPTPATPSARPPRRSPARRTVLAREPGF